MRANKHTKYQEIAICDKNQYFILKALKCYDINSSTMITTTYKINTNTNLKFAFNSIHFILTVIENK